MFDPENFEGEQFDMLAYVTAAAPLAGFALSPEGLAALADAFTLVMQVARPALVAPVAPDSEPAPVFHP